MAADVRRLAGVLVALAATGGAAYLTLTVAAGNRSHTLLAALAVVMVAAGWSLAPGVSPSPYGDLNGTDQDAEAPTVPGRARRGAVLLVLATGLAAFAIPFFYMSWQILLPLWLIACGMAFTGAAWLGSFGTAAPPPRLAATARRRHLVLFALCLLLGAFLRLYRIEHMPPGLFVDEGNIALDALQILDGRPDSPFWVGWYETPTLYAYYLAGLIKIGGPKVLTLKLASVIPGVLTIAAMYPLGCLLFGSRGALIATFLLAASRWHLSFSRWGWNVMMPPFFQVASTALLLYAFVSRRALHFFLAGFILGLGMYTYLASRLVLATTLGYVLLRVVFERGFYVRQRRGLLLFGLGFLLCFGPLMMTYLHSAFSFLNRTQQVSIFHDIAETGTWSPLLDSVTSHLMMFHGVGDANARHNLPDHPMLCAVAGTLLLLACGVALWRLRDHRFTLLILWVIFALQGGILTTVREAPQAYRTFGVVPAICLLCAATADAWTRVVGQFRALRPIAWLALLAALGFNAYTSYHQYFVEQDGDPRVLWNFSPAENSVARRVFAERERTGDVTHVYLSPRLYYFSPLRFLLYEPLSNGRAGVEKPLFHMMEPQADLPLAADGSRDVLLLLDPEVGQTLLILQSLYPHLRAAPVADGGLPLYTEVVIPKEDLIAVGRLAKVGADGVALPDADQDAGQPLDARIAGLAPGQGLAGAFKVPASGVYEFLADPALDIRIDGAAVAHAVRLGQGLHDIRLTRTDAAGSTDVLVQTPGKPPEPLDARQLFRVSAPREGLRGRYYSGAEWSGEPLFERVDPVIAFTWPGEEPTDGSFSIRWSGLLRAPLDGDYFFELHCDDGCALKLDGREVFSALKEGVQVLQTKLSLQAGLHPIEISYMQLGGGKSIRFSWRPPDGNIGLVPPDALIPDPAGWPEVNISPVPGAG